MTTNECLQALQRGSFFLLILVLGANAAAAQTSTITYQGRLTDAGTAANGNYDFQFALFSAAGGGTQIGSPLTRTSVAVSNGVFTVQLDFGTNGFPGADRFLEIGVRAASGGSFTTLVPRQQITASTYSIRTISAATADTATNAAQLGGVAASQYVVTSDARLSDPRPPTVGSSNYIQNSLAQQSSSNFNISGTGAAGVFNTATQYNIGGARMLSAPGTNNLFAGAGAGNANTGTDNAFFGPSAGLVNSSGSQNSFFGSFAGASNTTAARNAFFGYRAGTANWTAINNSFFGWQAGVSNVSGSDNSFFGKEAGASNVDANGNSYFGAQAGVSSTGRNNSFFGATTGALNSIGINNSFFGYQAGYFNESGNENSFFGKEAGTHSKGHSNSFFGNEAGALNSSGTGNTFIGAGVGGGNTTGTNNVFVGLSTGQTNISGSDNTVVGHGADVGSGNLSFATAIGAGAIVNASNTVVMGRTGDNVIVPGNLFVQSLGVGGSTNVCTTAAGKISTCSSSLRYKTSVHRFSGGLDIVRRLSPISFTWKDGGMHDVGFGAEEVEKIEPLLTIRNDKGEIEGVKYGQITTVLVNAVQQQQKLIEQQQRQIDALKKILCLKQPDIEVCSQ